MPRAAEVLRPGGGIGAPAAGKAPLFGADAGGGADVVNGHGEGGAVVVGVHLHHLLQPQAGGNRLAHGGTDQSPGVFCHEVDVFRSGKLGSADQIALVFPVGIVNTYNQFSGAQIFDHFFHSVLFHVSFLLCGSQFMVSLSGRRRTLQLVFFAACSVKALKTHCGAGNPLSGGSPWAAPPAKPPVRFCAAARAHIFQ